MYFFWQPTSTSPWNVALASERERIIREHQPALVTVLDVDNAFDRELTLDEYRGLKHTGPWYADFDGESIEEVIPPFQALLNKLRERRVDLDTCRIYATGGRGFHIEVPMGTFMPKVPTVGVCGLPHIYREIAQALYVEMLDLRVYSAKKGRMWRCQNVKRDNGKYKVRITADEALNMTPEAYDWLCSNPREAAFPTLPPTFNPDLGLLYAKAKDAVEASIKRAKSKKSKPNPLKRFGGQWPATVQAILQGEVIKDGVGWNRIAMQLALTADSLGKTEEELLKDATPLCETYSGDSDRYGSYRKRVNHLQEMFRYLAGNITYDWSAGGLVALVKPGTNVEDITAGEFVPDEPKPTQATDTAKGGDYEQEPEQDHDEEDDQDYSVVRYARSGIYVRDRDGDGWAKASHVGLAEPVMLVDPAEGTSVGYSVKVYVEGLPKGNQELPLRAFGGRAKFQEWTMQWSAAIRGSDMDISSLADVLRRDVVRSSKIMFQLAREGIDVIIPKTATGLGDIDVVYASVHGVESRNGAQYVFASKHDTNHARYSDLFNASPLEDTTEMRVVLDALFNINTPLNMGILLGWMSASFLCQPIRMIGKQFPFLQVHGEAGAGKTSTVMTVANLHYFLNSPQKMAASGQTMYPIIAAVTTQGSTPVIFEEFKPREMPKYNLDFLLTMLRNNYDGSVYQRGGVDPNQKGLHINSYESKAPITIIGEGLETQTALLERCVVLRLTKADRRGRKWHFDTLQYRQAKLGHLGRSMVNAALAIDFDKLRELIQEKKALVEQAMCLGEEDGKDRPIYNHAVILVGLEFLSAVLRQTFGNKYDGKIQDMATSILSSFDQIVPENKSEGSKVLDVMARLTREEDATYRLEKGRDYTLTDVTVDIRLHNAFDKYVRYTRSLGHIPLYDTSMAFIAAMTAYPGVVDTNCSDNPVLKLSPFEPVYRFSIAHLEKEKNLGFNP